MEPDTFATAREIAAAVQAGELSPVESVQRSLTAIVERDGAIHAFSEVWEESALKAAEELAQRADLAELPLAGVPFALKENTNVDNGVITPLIAAGAIPVGKTVNPQFCTWGTTTRPDVTVDNPIMPGHTPGGSSGGAAAAVAGGMVAFAQGNDGMGSLRIPAACCKLATLKATPGVIPGHVGGNEWYGMSVQGVLTQDVDDLMLITKILTDGRVDSAKRDLPETFSVLIDTVSPVFGLKPDEEYAEAARQAARLFADAGVDVTEASMPYPANPLPMLARWTAGVANELRDGGMPDHLEWRNRAHARLGRSLRWYIKDNQVVRARTKIESVLQGDQVLITPALAHPPLKNRPWHKLPWIANLVSNLYFTPFVSTWNFLGFPAGIVVEPVTGLPVQIVARPTQERILLDAMDMIARGGLSYD